MPKDQNHPRLNSPPDPQLAEATHKLAELVAVLRGENGCPWDRQQTPKTIIRHLQEETYELREAIDDHDPAGVLEELGDVLFHIIFLARIYAEHRKFDLAEVMAAVTDKMVRRHPHVFGSAPVDTPARVHAQWQRLKRAEKASRGITSALDGVPRNMPSLMRAFRISQRAVAVGFEWDDLAGVMDQAEAEWAELKAELSLQGDDDALQQRRAMEFGDLLFTLVNVARFAGFHPETALTAATAKFERRFKAMEDLADGQGRSLESMERQALEDLWQVVKAAE